MESKRSLQRFAESTRELWTKQGVRQAVRENLDKLTKCRTLALGAEIYASDSEIKTICHTCKSRFCPGCGNRATLTWQREQWRALPDTRYSEICFTMPKQFWNHFQQDRRLLSDIAALAASVIERWIHARYRVTPIILVIPHTFGRRLNFHPHLHILASAGGLNKRENRWIHFQHVDKYALMYWWRFTVVHYLAEVLGAQVEDVGALNAVLSRPRPKRLSFEAMSVKYFDSNPLLDRHGQRMRRVGRQAPVVASGRAA